MWPTKGYIEHRAYVDFILLLFFALFVCLNNNELLKSKKNNEETFKDFKTF